MQAPTKLWMNKHVVAYLYNRKYPVIVGLSCTTLCDPMDCSLPGVSIHGIFHSGILEWVAIPSKGDLPNPGTEPGSPALGTDSLLFEPPGKQLLSNKTQAIQETRVQSLGQRGPHWRRKWWPSPTFLPGKAHSQRILAGYKAWDCRSWTWLSD